MPDVGSLTWGCEALGDGSPVRLARGAALAGWLVMGPVLADSAAGRATAGSREICFTYKAMTTRTIVVTQVSSHSIPCRIRRRRRRRRAAALYRGASGS